MTLETGVKELAKAVGADVKALADGKVDSNDPRLTDAREWSAATVTQAEAEAGTASTRRAWTAQRVRQAIAAWYSTVSTTFTRTLLGRSTAAQIRGDLELGTAATRDVGESSGNVMEVGAFGWGGIMASGSNTDPNPTGFYHNNANAQAHGSGSFFLDVKYAAGNYAAFRLSTDTYRNNIYWQSGLGDGNYGLGAPVMLLHTGNIISNTGQSTEFPMTQKAVTDALDTKANTTTQVITGTGLSGGGNLSANRTLSVNYGTTAGTAAQGNDARITGAAQKSELGTAATRDVTVGEADTTSGRLLKYRDYGVGGATVTNDHDFSSSLKGGRFSYVNSVVAGPQPNGDGRGALISATDPDGYGMELSCRFGSNRLSFRSVSSAPRVWAEIFHTSNTATDSNGFIKNASPIIKLHSDRIESTNEEQFGATPTFARKSKGVYEIKGTLGLRSEGWYLDTPSDRNGNKYFNVEWTQNITPTAVDGIVDEYRNDIVVTIETFERVWNKETGMFDNGAPIDINELQDRFVQLRFNEIKIEDEDF